MQKSGIILLNKPVKISSNSAVNKVKFLIGAKKSGHLGTLDPLASGVLPVTFGKATRLFDYFLTKQKTYKAMFVFGVETDTLDCEGKITKITNCSITNKNISEILSNFIGEIEQMPPQFSALKVNGKKAYEIARSGEEVELKARKIQINAINFKKIDDFHQINSLFKFFIETNRDEFLSENLEKIKQNFYENTYEFEISCGAGTYIRSLARDVAKSLKTCGMMASLVRTNCGEFDIEQCCSFEDIQNKNFQVLQVDDVINLDKIEISIEESKKLLCGQDVKHQPFEGLKKLYSNSEFLGLAGCKYGNLKIEVYLKED